jgi:hypothetical protein
VRKRVDNVWAAGALRVDRPQHKMLCLRTELSLDAPAFSGIGVVPGQIAAMH